MPTRVINPTKPASGWKSPSAWSLVLVAAACGGGGSFGNGASAQEVQEVDPCTLITATEIEEVVGQPPGEPVRKALGTSFFECRWPSADGSEHQLAHVAFRPARAPATYEEWVRQYKAGMGDDFEESDLDAYQRIDGLGDYALFLDGGSLGGSLQVYDRERMLQVDTAAVPGASNLDLALALGRKAVERLP